MTSKQRCIVSVSMSPALRDQLAAACKASDVPLTVWVRDAIKARLGMQSKIAKESNIIWQLLAPPATAKPPRIIHRDD